MVIGKKDRKKMGDNADQMVADSKAIAGIKDLVRHAVRAESHPDAAHQNQDVTAIHRFYAPVRIDQVLYRVRLTVKDYSAAYGRRNLHALETVEIESALSPGTLPANPKIQQAQPTTTERTLSITQLLQGAIREGDGQPFVAVRQSRPIQTQSLTPTQARTQLDAALGKPHVQAMLDNGTLQIHATDPTGTGAAGYVKDGVMHLVPANMEGDTLSVALHEAMHLAKDDRFHDGNRATIRVAHAVLRVAGLKRFINDQTGFDALVKQAHKLAASGNVHAQKALAKARAETVGMAHLTDEEFLSYLVQYAPAKNSLVQRVLSAIRRVLHQLGVKVPLKVEDLRAFALSALKSQGRQAFQRKRTVGEILASQRDVRDLTPEQQFHHAASALQALAGNPDLYQYPKSQGKTLKKIAADLSLDLKVSDLSKNEKGQPSWLVTMPDGKIAEVALKNREVHINAIDLRKGESQGSLLYQLVATWAHNTGRVFVGDPLWISNPGKARRVEHLISSTLKFETTDHILPHEDQQIAWKKGDHGYNLTQLLMKSSQLINKALPDLKGMTYDFQNRRFRSAGGTPVTEALFGELAESPGARAAQAGRTTIKRTVLLNTLVQGAGRTAWRKILDELVSQGSATEGRLDPALEEIFYSHPNLTSEELAEKVLSGEITDVTPEQWAQVQAVLMGETVEPAPTGNTLKEWFGDSKIKDVDGKPLKMYHGTTREFTVFQSQLAGDNTTHPSAALGFFFTNDKHHAASKYGGNLLEVHLALENPYQMTDADLRSLDNLDDSRALRAKLEAQGYDGIIMPSETRTVYVAAFRSDQIKLTRNETFTKGESDIRYSRPFTSEQEAALDKIGKKPPQSWGQRLANLNDRLGLKFRQAVADHHAALLTLDQKAYGDQVVDKQTAVSSWVKARLSRSVDGALHLLIHESALKMDADGALDVQRRSKGLHQVLEPLGSEVNDFFAWVAGNRAAQLNKEGRENLFTDVDIAALKGLN